MKLGQLKEKISKASAPASADLSNDFKSIIFETDYRKISPFMRLFCEDQQKYLQSSQNNATYHPMNPDTDVTYQTVNLFSSDKCFIYFISELLLRFVLNFFAACLVSTSIRSISTSSLLAIIRSTSIIISSVFGHLFSRPSLAATYYGLMGCVGLSFKHKGYKINWY